MTVHGLTEERTFWGGVPLAERLAHSASTCAVTGSPLDRALLPR
ncbi:hypothetical protein O2W19_17865 [Modestobacter sp. VKM Ac-2980]|nr:hypothetical protein [Modestobacter sp. VKM Ac-2980]MCZ2843684.1 hypothetical protein [Modestobacter sp. VKM Ac-2980]